MKWAEFCIDIIRVCRPSHEGRGLKLKTGDPFYLNRGSPLTRGAWIEIPVVDGRTEVGKSPLTRGAWIEIPSTRPRRA